MEQNPYQPPRELDELERKPLTGKQILFWTMAIIGLPLAIITAGSSLCFGAVAVIISNEPGWKDGALNMFAIGVALALFATAVFWGWRRALKRVRNDRKMAAAKQSATETPPPREPK